MGLHGGRHLETGAFGGKYGKLWGTGEKARWA